MANPIFNPVSRQYEYPMESIYAQRQQERDAAEYEAQFGANVDLSQEGLDQAAEGGEQMPKEGAGKVAPDLESKSEQVRNKAQKAADQTLTSRVADTALKTLTGGLVGVEDLTPEGIQKFNAQNRSPLDAAKITDPVGNIVEKVAREEAKKQGLSPEDTEHAVSMVTLAAGIIFPMPGSGGKVMRAVGKAEGAAAKAGARAVEGVNPKRLEGAAPDVAQTIKNIGAFNAGRMELGTVSHAETIAKAADALTLEQAIKFDVNKLDLATAQTAIAGHYKAASVYLTEVSKRAALGDEAAIKEWAGAFAIAADLADKDALIGTALGRGLESRKIALSEINVLGSERMSEFAQKIAGSSTDPMIAAQRYLALTPTQRNKMLTQVAEGGRVLQDTLLEAWINSLLSNPATHVANSGASQLLVAWAPLERTLAATADYALSVGGLRTPRSVFFGEVPEMLYGAIEGYKDGFRIVMSQLREEAKLAKFDVPQQMGRGGVQKIERPPAITAERYHLNPESTLGAAVDWLGAMVRTSSRGLVTEDEAFKAVNYRMQVRALAYREAAQTGASGAEFAKAANERLANPGTAMKDAADQFAAAQTLNRELDELGPVARGLGKGATAIASYIPMARVVTPFIRTPANALDVTLEMVPGLNLVATNMRRDILHGTPEQRALALGKFAAGAMTSAVVASYCASPIDPENPIPYMTSITGEGPRDKAQIAQLRALGWQPYSKWDGSQYVSYKRLDPIGAVIGTVCTATEMIGQLPDAGVKEVATATGIAVGKAMLSKTFLEGLSNFLDTMEGKPEDFNRFAQSLARSGVPAGVRQVTRTMDPTLREMDTLFDHWRSGLPGYDGPPVVNLWGDPVMLSGGLGLDLISPLYTSPGKPDDVTEWLLRNRVPVPGTPRVLGGAMPPNVQLDEPTRLKGIKLTSEEKHRLGVLIGKGGEAGDLEGGAMAGLPPLKEAIRSIIDGPGTGGPEGSKADLIRERIKKYREAAERQLRRESPMLDDALTALERQRIDLKVNEPAKPAGPPGMADVLKNLIPTLGR